MRAVTLSSAAKTATRFSIRSAAAGMAAAIELTSAGRRVTVPDMQPAPGGQVFRALEANLQARPATDALLAALGPSYTAGQTLIRRFRATAGIDYRPGTTVWELRADGTVGWLQGDAAGYLRARHVVLLLGALAVGGYTSQRFLPEVSQHFSPRDVFDTYNKLAQKGEPLAQHHVEGRAASYYAQGEVRDIASWLLLSFSCAPGTRLGRTFQRQR